MTILITGGSGLLGQEILKLDKSLLAPSHSEMDITDLASVQKYLELHKPEIVLHLAAATKPPQHTEHPEVGLKTNILGTANLALACLERKIRLVYTSTDYVYVGDGPHKENEPLLPPHNFGWSKLGGEAAVVLCPNSLILRLSFGPVPYPWEKVYDDQVNSKLYADEMAPLVLSAVKSSATGIMNIGGPRTSLLEYAKRTVPAIQTIPTPEWVPKDTSLDITKMKEVLGIDEEKNLLRHGSI